MTHKELKLNGFSFTELQTASGLQRLDQCFLAYLHEIDTELYQRLLEYRQQFITEALAVSELIIACGPICEQFIAELFNIQNECLELQCQTLSHEPIFQFKKHFVLRLAKRNLQQADKIDDFSILDQWLTAKLSEYELSLPNDRQLAVAHYGVSLLTRNEHDVNVKAETSRLVDWCVAAMTTSSGRALVANWEMFALPERLDFSNLVPVIPVADDPYARLEGPKFRHRDGFDLTDKRMSQRQAMSEVHYCVYCHENTGDFCSKGFPVKKTDAALGLKINPVGETLTGCPLEEKISEMHVLKKQGHDIAALAVIMIDNPMCPATGHRICNDCMKACIYQKQQPVNIPETETRILTDVLHLPWGVEIYELLTRWNPLRATQWVLKPYNGLKILIMGMGPAGFTLAHHLLMEGFAVVGVDGLKIEPLPQLWQQPIYSWTDLQDRLATRVMAGFGGVAEYGITVRWDKNFLKLIYLSLLRHQYFQVFGSVRFGGTLTVEDAWWLGFDHLAVAVGAGLPKELSIPNSLAPGMRQANDFLMALQLSGAAKQSSLANLQVRMPALVIGGGLTGVDTATEVQAYYLVQIEKIAKHYFTLVQHFGENDLRARFDACSLSILDEFLQHAAQLDAERQLAKQEKRPPNLIQLLRRFGGVTIVYRHAMPESPAYRRNPEELSKALEEGIYYAEGMEPAAVLLDQYDQVQALKCRWSIYDEEGNWQTTDEEQILPARAIFVATGARLNVAYEFEHRGTFVRRQSFEYQRYESIEGQLHAVTTEGHVKSPSFGPFTSYQNNEHRVTFLGDTHPIFHGSVVKAIASAKRTYPYICDLFTAVDKPGDPEEYAQFRTRLAELFNAEVVSVRSLAQDVTEVVVKAPLAAAKFAAGQFYRLQNYECLSPILQDTKLQIEGLALLGIRDVKTSDRLIFICLERGVSSRLLKYLRPGEPIALMGPTGAQNMSVISEPIMIVGGRMAAIFLLSIVSAEVQTSTKPRILFVACFAADEAIFYREQLAEVAEIIWVDYGASGVDMPAQSLLPNWLNQLRQYALTDAAQPNKIALTDIKQIYIIGATELLRSFQHARPYWQVYFAETVKVHASVYGPMQCMLKGVCAQCLQWQINPQTGERTKAVYACSWQHQPLAKIDIDHIDQRLMQNQCQEVLSDAWLDYILEDFEESFSDK